MTRALIAAALILSASLAQAQEQQAGNAASRNAEETFQKLVDRCDNTDMLILRAKVRLQLSRTTEKAAATAQSLMEDGFGLCGSGDIDTAMAKLEEALVVSAAGSDEKFGTDTGANPVAAEAAPEEQDSADASDTPWWKLW
ncbi:hypothetical protein [Actibacterium sp. 188UL27-1]|uniref:hypothetical protein n=1 Tax=Actibacterium sp. 188UL27-1 TaxID=2786961 RepID=UPI001956AE11|nr:hypothetical protein [Actibacterium sp. 188UL27-1]MBM7066125.1 hypothetical protein [Actibacterium sp. 188UL27-1]